jgi:hypothetical protein
LRDGVPCPDRHLLRLPHELAGRCAPVRDCESGDGRGRSARDEPFHAAGSASGQLARGVPKRPLNIFFATIAATGYAVQLLLAVALLSDSESSGLVRALIFVLVALFGSALLWAWEVGGIGHRVPHEVAYPGHLEERKAESVRTPRAETS